METVLRNLLYNAMRYAARRILVRFRVAPGGTCRLCVDDDGPGIPEDDRLRVFDSFVQLGEKNGVRTGFGLGLAIVKRIVSWHGGSASVTRSDLGGAGFRIEWPEGPGHRSRTPG